MTNPIDRRQFLPVARRTLIALVTQFLLILAPLVLYFYYPVMYVRLISEDNIGESATFLALITASVLFAILFVTSRKKKGGVWHLLLAAGTFFIAMEEISWGQRLLGFHTPDFLQTINFQGEFTVHNISAVAPTSLTYRLLGGVFAVYGLVFPLLVAVSQRIRRVVEYVGLPLPPLHLAPIFMATAYFLNSVTSSVMTPLIKTDEIGELFMGLSLGCLAIDQIFINKRLLIRRSRVSALLPSAIISMPILWVAFSEFLVPLIIERAYFETGPSILSDLMAGRARTPLSAYLARWREVSWHGLGYVVLFSVISVTFLTLRLAPRTSNPPNSWTEAMGIPIFCTTTLLLATPLTWVDDNSIWSLNRWLNQFAGDLLPAKGHYQQAEAIFAYLEANQERAEEDLSIRKGELYFLMGREMEAKGLFREALGTELERYSKNPKDPEVLRRLADIYHGLGEDERSRNYINELLRTYDASLRGTKSEEEKAKLRIKRAELYENMGDYKKAFEEYIKGDEVAVTANLKRTIKEGFRGLLSNCRAEKGLSCPLTGKRFK